MSCEKIESITKLLKGLYKIETTDLCEDEIKVLYGMMKKMRKKLKKLQKEKDGEIQHKEGSPEPKKEKGK
jgi:hypothetical protein